MIWIFRVLFFSIGGAALALLARRRRRPLYPAPESYIIRLADDVPDRFLQHEGLVNFRDVGGYRTGDGRQVKRGLVYRSGTLVGLSPAARAAVEQLGVKLVCDLRSAEEVRLEPYQLPGSPMVLSLPLDGEDSRGRRLRALLFKPEEMPALFTEMYTRVLIDSNARLYGDILKRLADPANLPTIIHCTAGKDRTGVAAALLLLALGVPEETVIADYSLSNAYFTAFQKYGAQAVARMRWMGITADDIQPFLVADPERMRAVIDHIKRKYGSVERYLREAAGVDNPTLNSLRMHLLE